MRLKSRHIPVYALPEGSSRGIMLLRERFDGTPNFAEVERSHRDGGYTFIIQEEGITHIEIDFQTYTIEAPSIVFIKPDQVHRLIAFEHALISTFIITEDNLRPEYLSALQHICPVKPLGLDTGTMLVFSEAAKLSIKVSEKKEEKLYNAILMECCNTLVAITVSQYLARHKTAGHYTRYEAITHTFKAALEKGFKKLRNPAQYAKLLNISAPYLNECVKAVTGLSVTANIQQRLILEAKRQLFHSSRSVKEIAGELGYHDHSYFIRLFSRISGCTPIAFRRKNHE